MVGGENTTLAQMAKCLGIPAAPNESDKSGDSEKPPATNGSESCEQEEKTSQDDVKLLEDILVKLICDGEYNSKKVSLLYDSVKKLA